MIILGLLFFGDKHTSCWVQLLGNVVLQRIERAIWCLRFFCFPASAGEAPLVLLLLFYV